MADETSGGGATPAPAAPSAAAPTNTTESEAPKPLKFSDLDAVAFDKPDARVPGSIPPETEVDSDSDTDADDDEIPDSIQEEVEEDDEVEGEDEEDEEEAEGEDEEEEGDDDATEDSQKGALHEVKVDGKVKKFTLDQLKTIASSGLHTFQKREEFQAEMNTQREALDSVKAELAVANTKITPIWDCLKKNDAKGAILEIGKTLGKGRLEVERVLLQQHIPLVAARLGLSPEETRARLEANAAQNRHLDLRAENEYYKELEREREEQEKKAQKPPVPKDVLEAQQAISRAQEEHSISNGELKKAYSWLHEKVFNGDASRITVDGLINTVLNSRVVERAVDAIMIRRPKLAQDSKFVDKLVGVLKQNPDWTADRIGRWIEKRARGRSGNSADPLREISRKVQKSGLKPRFESSSGEAKKPMKFSDFDEDSPGLP